MIKRLVVLGVAVLCMTASSATAQRSSSRGSTPIEFGIDGGILFGLDQPRATALVVPLQDFRIGFLVTDRVAIEPRFNLISVHTNGLSATSYKLELGVVYQPAGDRVGNGFYSRPFIGMQGANATGAGSDNSGYMGFGLGLKIPFADRRLATRLEANYSHLFDTGGSNVIGLLFGLSFFTR